MRQLEINFVKLFSLDAVARGDVRYLAVLELLLLKAGIERTEKAIEKQVEG